MVGDPVEQQVHELVERSRAVVYSSPAEAGDRIDFVSDNVSGLLGCTARELLAEPGLWRNLMHPADARSVLERRAATSGRVAIDYRMRHVRGDWVWVHDDSEVVTLGTRRARVGCWTNVSDRRAREDELRHESLHDTVTDLPNRVLALSNVTLAQHRARRNGMLLALLYIDLDRFTDVNDRYGRAAGDVVLRAVARRLRGCLRGADTAASLGGDQFLVLCEDLHQVGDLAPLIARIHTALNQPIPLRSEAVTVECSIGVVVGGSGSTHTAERLVQDADIARYRAKSAGGNRAELYDPRFRAELAERTLIEQRLRRPVGGDEMLLYYQPIIDLRTHQVSGVEALLRWRRGLDVVLPGSFLKVAEDAGLVPDLGRWALERACVQAARWREQTPAGGQPIMLSVNVSGRQLAHAGFVESVRHALRISGLAPHALCLEVTEASLATNQDRASAALEEVNALGVRAALDDFGIGFASLDHLRRLPTVDLVKIDRSHIAGLGRDPFDLLVSSAAVAIAKAMGARTVAEGIETPDQLSEARRLGCDLGQGFLLASPAPPEQLDQILGLNGSGGLNTAGGDPHVPAELPGFSQRRPRIGADAGAKTSTGVGAAGR